MSQGADGRVIAVIPARGGSKGVPGKNVRRIGGVPLVVRAIEACRLSGSVDIVSVSTDDDSIADLAHRSGATVVDRPMSLAGDTATSESALLHALDELGAEDGDVLVFVQCTSPFIPPDRLAEAVRSVVADEFDSIFSGVESFEFLWRRSENGSTVGVNHDHAVRLRRQDRSPDFRETGAFYVMKVDGFRRAGHRFFGRVGVVAVPSWTAVEIDEPADIDLASALGRVFDDHGGNEIEIDVDVVVTDFDGVHTDDRVLVSEGGLEAVWASRSDGYGIDLLRRAGVPLLILSREVNGVVAARAKKLSVECVHGVDDKWPLLRTWLSERGIDPIRCAYVGNDLNDLECMQNVGWPIAVADAHPAVLDQSRRVLRKAGGQGAVRELAELVVAARSVT